MSPNEYQEKANEFAILDRTDFYARSEAVAGLAGETGELCEIYKRRWRGDFGTIGDAERVKLIKEMGDVLWYLCRLASLEEIDLEYIMTVNINKLNARKMAKTIQGKGDER